VRQLLIIKKFVFRHIFAFSFNYFTKPTTKALNQGEGGGGLPVCLGSAKIIGDILNA
jgi:hypothetical protein